MHENGREIEIIQKDSSFFFFCPRLCSVSDHSGEYREGPGFMRSMGQTKPWAHTPSNWIFHGRFWFSVSNQSVIHNAQCASITVTLKLCTYGCMFSVEYKKESQKCVCTFFRIGWIKYIEGLTTLSECTTDDPWRSGFYITNGCLIGGALNWSTTIPTQKQCRVLTSIH